MDNALRIFPESFFEHPGPLIMRFLGHAVVKFEGPQVSHTAVMM
jgi:hypothetical protein